MKIKQDTLVARAGLKSTGYNGSINPPIYHLSTILFPTVKDYYNAQNGENLHYGYESGNRDCSYGTVGSSTAADLGNALALLEMNDYSRKKCDTLLYPSGLVALTVTTSAFTKTGDHVLVPENAYGPFRRFASQELINMGIEVTFYNHKEKIHNLIRNNTSLIMMESPNSITFEMVDVEEVVKLAKAKGIITVMDNTWATPIFFKPLEHGIDVSLYAATKYINGHSDVLMGVTHASGAIFKRLYNTYRNSGISVNSQDCYFVQRGLRTLLLRLERHQKTALKVAKYLENIPEVIEVLYPALPSSSQHQLWKKYFTGATALFSIIVDKKYSQEQLSKIIDPMELFGIGASWGGYKSLILPFDLDNYNRPSNQYHTSCIRIFCGLEDVDDLIEDLSGAFDRLRKIV